MPNTWRPDNWQQEYYYGGSLSCLIHDYGEPNKVFEAGAAAMLEALREDGWRPEQEHDQQFISHDVLKDMMPGRVQKGCWVFIQDDEEKDER